MLVRWLSYLGRTADCYKAAAMPVSTQSLREVAATRYVTPLREGGSLPGLVEADDDGLYVTKFRGAGQGLRALVAEVIVGELARGARLLVPELVTVAIDPRLGAAEPDPEIQELITGSEGVNLGVDFLPGALAYTPAGAWQPSEELAADIVWLDALATNVDRTARNPNLLLWHERLWVIDHGAALYLQHGGLDPVAHAERPFPLISDHVLLRCAGSIPEADERMRARLGERAVQAAVDLVPEQWFAGADPPEVYVDYLTRRLASAVFVEEAERARSGR
jgi:HipA-like kinase